jgi:hypothetical protein
LSDAQKEYTEGLLPLWEIEPSVDALSRFLIRARAAKTPVIHVVQVGRPRRRIFDPQRRFVEIIDKVRPVAGEPGRRECICPARSTHTTLEAELTRIGRKKI